MKRKLTAILLASMLAGVLLAGCGGNNAGTQSSPAADNAGSAVSEAGSGTETVTPDAGAAATTAEAAKTDEELAA